MQEKKFNLVSLILLIQFILISYPLFSSEIDQFTNREKYQDSASDFSEILNQYTNKLIELGVHNFNEKYMYSELSVSEIHKYVAFEIYKMTAGFGLKEYLFPIPPRLNLPYALLVKSGQGPIQRWIKGEQNNSYWIYNKDNIYSETYPVAVNENVIVKVGNEFIGSDKVDHFFDQGYSYWVQSDYGLSDWKAKEYGVDSEKKWFGLSAGGVFSFADLRANWGGYQFYKNLFSGDNSLLLVSKDGRVNIRHSFDWTKHIDWQFDELKNPSLYIDILEKRILKHISNNIDSYRETYKFLEERGLFSFVEKRDSFYLTDEFETVKADFTELKALLTGQIQIDKEIALVFSGGGGRGAFEIGVWKALSDLGFKIGGVYGTSVGSINGTGIIMEDYQKVRDLWFDISYLTVMDLSKAEENLLRGDLSKLSFEEYITIVKDFWTDAGIDVTPLKGLLANIISEEEVRASDIDYGLSLFSVSNMEPKMIYIDQIPQGELINYILASANFPLFRREEIRGEIFMDGGVYSNIPIEMAVKKGYQNIVVVDIGLQTPVDVVNSLKQNFYSSVNIKIIKPREQYGSFLTFEKEVSEKYLIEGYLDTMKVYNYIHGDEYYIYGSEDIIWKKFNSLNIEKQYEALSLLGIDIRNRTLTNDIYKELVIPVFESVLPPNSAKENIALNLLESLAKNMDIEPLTVYTQEEILKIIVNKTESEILSTQIIDFIRSFRYIKIIKFLKYMNNNSSNDSILPKGYNEFMIQLNTLME